MHVLIPCLNWYQDPGLFGMETAGKSLLSHNKNAILYAYGFSFLWNIMGYI